MSPRKVRLVVELIRGRKADDAVRQLAFSDKMAARPVLKLLKSAIANAKHNHEIDEKTLKVKTAYADGGPILYRHKPRAHGSASPIRKRTAHIVIVLEGDTQEDDKAKKQK